MQARVRLPAARGAWATFWSLGRSYRENLRWPQSGEIDAIEYRGARPNEVDGVLHCPACGEPVGRRGRFSDTGGLAGDFHTFTVDWSSGPDRIDWYVDGHRYHSVDRAEQTVTALVQGLDPAENLQQPETWQGSMYNR
jgi:beta-glucanase (GH16 family)